MSIIKYDPLPEGVEISTDLPAERELQPNTCSTCRFWSFKSSGEGPQCWGKCTNEKMREAFYLSIDFPTLGCKGTDEYHQFAEWVKSYVDIRVEENTFGCIHYEGEEE